MYLATLRKPPYVNSTQLMIIIYKIHYLIQSRSMAYASVSRLTMYSLVNHMTKDNLDTNIIVHETNLIITISSRFPPCYVMHHGLH